MAQLFDLLVGIAGCADITCEGLQGNGVAKLRANSFCSMPPGVRHEERNISPAEDAVFMVMHAPNEGYDFIPVEFRTATANRTQPPIPGRFIWDARSETHFPELRTACRATGS